MEIVLRQLHRFLDSPPSPLVIALVAAFFFLSAVPSGAAEPKAAEPQKAPAPVPSPVIPVADVATRAMEASNLIRTFNAQLAPSPEIETIRKQLPGVSRNIDLQLAGTQRILLEQPALETLQTQQQLWQDIQRRTAGWLNGLTIRASKVQDALDQLADLQKTWTRTRDAARASRAPGPILQQIDATLVTLEAAQAPLHWQRTSVLDLQSQVAGEVARCGTALAQIAQAQHMVVGGTFTRDGPPIWSADLWAQAQTMLPALVSGVAAAYWAGIRQYVREPSMGMPLEAGIFVGLALLLCAARRQVDRWASSGEGTSSAAMVFDRPYAAALMVSLVAAAGPLSPAPPVVRELCEVLALAPMIRLIRPVVHLPVVPPLYALGVLFAFDSVRQAFAGAPLIGQMILVLEALAGVVVLWWFLRSGHLQSSLAHAKDASRPRAINAGAGFVLLVLAAGLVAGVLGYLRLARLLTPGVLAGGALAVTLYALLRVFGGAVAFALRVWPLRLLQMVQHKRDLLERRLFHWLGWLAFFAWAVRFLDYIGLLDPTLTLGGNILALRLERGSISTSVGDILVFFLTVWAAYLLSAFIRFVLQEDVYPRIGVPRGLSYATSSLIHYIMLALGLVVGLGLLGVNLTQVTILAGAFGVGIGFGLQNVVNNFVSGLILLFERPIHVGDTIEVGDLLGKVGRIGMRASTVRTWNGADIIVPNSQLISDKVTNWTLGDQLRRIDLPVGVNYSAPPQEVIKVLEAVAGAHPRILKDPPPQALFVGYGDSSINFELRAWTDQFDSWPRIRSDLAVALYDAVHETGMAFPFPQREVRLLPDPGARSKT
jgi:potassium efflux system protein